VSAGRLRTAEWLAGTGAVALTALLFLDWFEPQAPDRGPDAAARVLAEPSQTGWMSLGWLLALLLIVTVLLAVWLVAATATDASVGQAVMAAVLLSATAPIALLVLVVRVAVVQPDLGAGLPDAAVAVQPAAYAGLAALAVLVAGAWRSLADERTDAKESAYTPPPARPAPPERA
jgi:hypothetical protein